MLQLNPSLNDCLDVGPSLLPLLYDILLRFRLNKVALTGDIEKAFLNIRVAPEHRDLLRFLWVEDIEAENPKIVVYRFASVLFGCISSPFLLNQTVKHHMATFSDDEEFVSSVSNSLYCDDFIGGCNSVEDALTLYEKLKTRFQQDGFNMRKWMSNCQEVLDKLGENENSVKVDSEFAVNAESEPTLENVCEPTKKVEETKVLGMLWKPKVDELIFDFNAMLGASAEENVSKREVLATTAKLFDPVGLISPIIVPLKLVFQKLCKQNKDWDESIDESILKDWNDALKDMRNVGNIAVNRPYLSSEIDFENVDFVELHWFSEASKTAYGACVYIVYQLKSGERVSSLVSSKTRIAPITGETIPRLELLSALILARLMKSVQEALSKNVKISQIFCWSDSQITLWWLASENKVLKSFVENRVREIKVLYQ